MSERPIHTLADLAARFGLELRGEGQTPIQAVATIQRAQAGQITFLANPQYRQHLASCAAAAVILRAADLEHFTGNALIARDPYVAYAKIAALFADIAPAHSGVHPSAVVADDARIASTAWIGPQCVIESGCEVASGAQIGPGCVILRGCSIGEDSQLVARVTLGAGVVLGRRVLVHPGAVIGADGFGLAFDQDHWHKVPQLGTVRIGDDCEIGANTTIDRGALDDTVLEEDVRLDNQIQIAHNVHVGAHTAIAGCAAVAGSARIGRYCLIGGGAGILGHLTIADRVTITAMSLVTHSIREAGEYSSGTPIQPNREWRRNAARFRHLDEFARRLKQLEQDDTP